MTFSVGNFTIGTGRAFVIAEIGNNHNGSLERAINLIDLAQESGADCVKFQMRNMQEVYRKRSLEKKGEDLGTEYIVDLLDRFELSLDEHHKLAKYCEAQDILYLCTPWDAESLKALEDFKVPAYKVASADLTNLPLLDAMVKTGKPLIISTGMSTAREVQVTVNFLNQEGAPYVLLHCNSTYPAPLHDINLRWINNLKNLHELVGYSGHERGYYVAIAAVALGACVIEKHFTLDRQMEGPDHAASLEAEEFCKMVQGIREIEEALGTGEERVLSQGEMINRENLSKSLIAATAIKAGTTITPDLVRIRSPGQGISPQQYEALLGVMIKRDMGEEDFFFPSDLLSERVMPREYHFGRPWGVPVRYHDFNDYSALIQPDIWEFHFSYSDMDLNPKDYISANQKAHVVVHAPELFSESRLMDLATPDDEYRDFSIRETQRLVDITRRLKTLFPETPRPMIIANIGGFTMDGSLPPERIDEYYERFGESLNRLDLEGVELIPQTMAPFPWHFGGQRYQNLFVHIEEIVKWCEQLGLRMCFDVSHSFLSCNHFNKDFYKFSSLIAPITGHLHLGDAKNLNGEGLQIGDGDIDFPRLGEILGKGCPEASFIPEIWQGHKNDGEGFWIALDRLEGALS